MQPKSHWENVYSTKQHDRVSWFQEHAERSLSLIRGAGVSHSASIIDVGGGASTLVDDLLNDGFSALTVLDVSAVALSAAQARLGARATSVLWLEANITSASLPVHAYDLWHDRAVFHFLIEASNRKAYVECALRSVKPGGHVIVATFAQDGPTECSGLQVKRYSPGQLHAEFGPAFDLIKHESEQHHTPFGTVQKFLYCHFRVRAS